ncbi:IS481 family transposase, partial [Arthrobacter sp. E44]
MSHANALLTPKGRLRLARCIVDDGWPLRRAAERFQVSVTTAARWAARYREHGEHGTGDRSSRPINSPRRTSTRRERRIVAIRVNRRWGPARIGYLLGIHPSTVHRVLSRFGLARLAWMDRATGRVIRRYEHHSPGDLVHVDIKKLGRIPDGGGHRSVGRAAGNRNKTGTAANRRPGHAFLHNAVDDHSRLAYTEILTDEKKDTAAGFWERANAYFESHGITVKRVLTDNGSCYRSYAFKDALGPDIKHKRTRPYRPQTNGKVERYNRTMLDEWAYARPYASEAERVAAFADWLHHYNHHRGH